MNIIIDEIIVRHPKTPTTQTIDLNKGLIISGHSHKSQSLIAGNAIHIGLPSLSNIENFNQNRDFSLPGFTVANISFNKGYFKTGVFEQYIFLDKMYKVNELNYELMRGTVIKDDVIKYEEERPKKEKTYVKEIDRKSQFDKFKDRYNK